MRTSWAHRGFSLVELLTVIAIIILIVSIVLPVLGSARDTGRRVATEALLGDLSKAASAFQGDHGGRTPGYFSPREMGSVDNADRGMSEMENVLLDLAGQGAIMEQATASTVEVGPVGNQTIFVDPSLIGAQDSYFKPSGEFYVPQLAISGQQISNVSGHAGSSDSDVQLYDLVDAFRQPVLFWTADAYTVPSVTRADDFVRVDSGNEPAQFYWNTNAAFLKSTNLGRLGHDMTVAPNPEVRTSLIGQGAMDLDPNHVLLSMQALLGSPSDPRAPQGQTVEDLLADPASGLETLFPGRAKGDFVIHSAGRDGVYLSSADRGFRRVAHEGDHIEYGLDFFTGPDGRVTDDNDRPTSRDVISEFDDIVVSGGG